LLPAPPSPDDAPARYETVNRTQIELRPCDLESVLPPGHAARLVWRFVEGLDLSAFYAAIRAREGHAGRSPIDPRILTALWLYATIDGVGSAREVDRLCEAHDAYRWLRGGVSVNYHTLSDFRVGHQAALDDLLTQSITALVYGGIVTLARVAHDGTRIRASAGVGSFRRRDTLEACQTAARKQVERTARQTDGEALSREAAAQGRAAREREARVDEALQQLPAIQAARDRNRRRRERRAEARASTTDPDARVMKLADGGFRPAYNVQFATDMASRVIVGVTVTNVQSDQGSFTPMLTQVQARLGAELPAWTYEDGWIRRKYRTSGWKSTLMVVNTVGHLAEAAWHHPDMTVSYAFVNVKLMNHAAKGITDKDFELARKIDEVVGWEPAGEGSALTGPPERFAVTKPD